MLYLGFEFYNAHAEVMGGQAHIVPTDVAKPSYMVVVFPSQHLGEQSVEYTPGMTTWPSPPLHGALAGFSWLAFELRARRLRPLHRGGPARMDDAQTPAGAGRKRPCDRVAGRA